jgi:hypothetical protein
LLSQLTQPLPVCAVRLLCLLQDQLHIEKARGHAFVGFTEGRIRFPPTYKYKTGSDEYDKVR